MVTYHEELPLFVSQRDILNTLYLHLRYNNGHQTWWLSVMGFHPLIQIKLLHSAYGHKTYHGGDIPREAPTYKFAWNLNEAVMRGNMTN